MNRGLFIIPCLWRAGAHAHANYLPPTDRPTASGRTANPLLHLCWYIKGTFWGREKLWRPPSLCVDEKVLHSKIDERWGQFASNTLRKLRHVGAIVFREMSSSFQQHHHLFRAHGMIKPYFEYWIVSCSDVSRDSVKIVKNKEYRVHYMLVDVCSTTFGQREVSRFILRVTESYSFPSAGRGSLVKVIDEVII